MFTWLIIVAISALFVSYILIQTNTLKYINIIRKTFRRDAKAITRFVDLNRRLRKYKEDNATVLTLFEKQLQSKGEKVAVYFEEEKWTFNDIERVSNQVAQLFAKEGFKKGDCIGLLMENCPEYVVLWLGLAKLGVTVALINTNLMGNSLCHCLISAGHCTALIFSDSFKKTIEDVQTDLKNVKLYQLNTQTMRDVHLVETAKNLRQELEGMPTFKPEVQEPILATDVLLYIYTSGTTGLPKAAVVTHQRYILIVSTGQCMLNLRQTDIMYTALPLYHAAGGILGIGQIFSIGISVAVRKKFSAKNFWPDCVKYNCTVAQYIGELCRYILAAHTADTAKIQHCVRIMVGNGLKPNIWQQFVDRFGVKEIYEVYGATEGNANMVNVDGKVGAVGFIPFYMKNLLHISLIKCDQETGDVIRNADGFCIKCSPGEPGLIIGRIDGAKSMSEFVGYSNKDATNKKIIYNVFTKGDAYFNSGDILIQDELGYLYFKDRTGDTFRWKGENVSTTEVEEVISNLVNYRDVAVYGVEIPETEGRAGMAAIVDTDNSINMEKLSKDITSHLPKYAIPLFVRLVKSIPITGTFKIKKMDLRREGYDINCTSDAVYMYTATKGQYILLTPELYNDILEMKIKV